MPLIPTIGMAKKKLQRPTTAGQAELLKRTRRVTITLNEREYEVLQRYFKRYRISNRTRLVRELLMRHVISRLEGDAPSLFDEPENV